MPLCARILKDRHKKEKQIERKKNSKKERYCMYSNIGERRKKLKTGLQGNANLILKCNINLYLNIDGRTQLKSLKQKEKSKRQTKIFLHATLEEVQSQKLNYEGTHAASSAIQ